MTGSQRREQLIRIGRELFAEKGFDGASVEEISARAQVSKPVVYEHFGGKEGIYAVIVDREVTNLTSALTSALAEGGHPRAILERTALALLDYIEANTDGFRILVRDSPVAQATGTFSSLIGMIALTGQWWLEAREPSKDVVAAHLVNLAWNGLRGMEASPEIRPDSREAVRGRRKADGEGDAGPENSPAAVGADEEPGEEIEVLVPGEEELDEKSLKAAQRLEAKAAKAEAKALKAAERAVLRAEAAAEARAGTTRLHDAD